MATVESTKPSADLARNDLPESGPTRSGWRSFLGFALWLILCFGAAAFGSQFQPGSWYASLTKPSWNPPNQVFGPVWSALYMLMSIAAWLVWRRGGFSRQALPLGAFVLQLVLNALWSWLFFGLHQPLWAFVELCLLWVAIASTLLLFRRVSTAAAWCLVPYLAWVSFAGFLNYTLWRLN